MYLSAGLDLVLRSDDHRREGRALAGEAGVCHDMEGGVP